MAAGQAVRRMKICTALDCGVEDIMEIVPDSSENA